MNQLRERFENQKKWLYFSLAATFIWGLVAHAYCFFDNSFSHDSLNELHGAIFGTDWKVELGRVFVPFYRDLIRSDVTLPWLIGMLSLFWIGISVFLVLRIFDIQSKPLAFLTAGVLTANVSVMATAATYLHDLDCYMLSLVCAVAAVYLWKRYSWGFLPGALFVTVSLGMYQSYLTVTIALVMFVCILDLLDGQTFKTVFTKGLKAICMILIGGGLYFVSMKVIQKLMSIQMATGNYNTMDTALTLTPQLLAEMVIGAYRDCAERFLNAYSSYPSIMVKGITILLLILSLGMLAAELCSKKVHIPEKLLCIALIVLLPLGMNIIYVLVIGVNHDLMVYAIWLTYLLMLLLSDRFAKKVKEKGGFLAKYKAGEVQRGLCLLLVFVLLYGNVQFANGLYLKKDLEYDAYLSLMTRVTDRMEETEEYVPGETPVYFAGIPDLLNDEIPGFREYQQVVGATNTDVIFAAYRSRYQAYFDYVLGIPVDLVEDAVWDAMWQDPRVQALPSYPAKGCIAVIDGILVVKLGKYQA